MSLVRLGPLGGQTPTSWILQVFLLCKKHPGRSASGGTQCKRYGIAIHYVLHCRSLSSTVGSFVFFALKVKAREEWERRKGVVLIRRFPVPLNPLNETMRLQPPCFGGWRQGCEGVLPLKTRGLERSKAQPPCLHCATPSLSLQPFSSNRPFFNDFISWFPWFLYFL